MKYGPTKYKLDEELHQLFEKFYLPSLVLELGGLGYFTKYPSPLSSGTNLHLKKLNSKLINLILLRTRAWWARVLCEVPEPIKLGYEAG